MKPPTPLIATPSSTVVVAYYIRVSIFCGEVIIPHLILRASEGPRATWGFPKIRGTVLGVPIIRTIVFLGLYWGSRLFLGEYHMF